MEQRFAKLRSVTPKSGNPEGETIAEDPVGEAVVDDTVRSQFVIVRGLFLFIVSIGIQPQHPCLSAAVAQ